MDGYDGRNAGVVGDAGQANLADAAIKVSAQGLGPSPRGPRGSKSRVFFSSCCKEEEK